MTVPEFHPLPFDLSQIPIRGTAYVVGGSVRDLLRGEPATDVDIAFEGSAPDFAQHLARRLDGHLVVLGKGNQRIWRVAAREQVWDIAPLQGPDIDADLLRRDFTINALAMACATGKILDPTGGLSDLQSGLIRMTGSHVFRRDPLRLVRAYRLSATLGFALEDGTQAAIGRDAHRLTAVAGERVRVELLKLLAVPAHAQIQQMQRTGVLQVILPELKPLEACPQNTHHTADVLTHTLGAFETLENILDHDAAYLSERYRAAVRRIDPVHQPLLKLALLLHDIGKPSVQSRDRHGPIHFYGHARHGADLSQDVARRLRLSRHAAGYLDHIIRCHQQPLQLFLAQQRAALSRKARVRFFARCDPYLTDVLLHAVADQRGKADTVQRKKFIDWGDELLREYTRAYLPLKRSPALVSGKDLMQVFHLSPSPLFGRILAQVETERLAGTIASRPEALQRIRQILAQRER